MPRKNSGRLDTIAERREALTTYLNDHLAGSVAAVQLLDRLVRGASEPEAREFFTAIRADVQEDQGTLVSLLRRSGGTKSGLRQVGGWLTAVFGRLKLWLDDPAGSSLHQLEALEALSLGIQGKYALWRALAAVADRCPALREVELPRLERRALEQHGRVEARRLVVARTVLSATAERTMAEPGRRGAA
jgi:hypothetical protein